MPISEERRLRGTVYEHNHQRYHGGTLGMPPNTHGREPWAMHAPPLLWMADRLRTATRALRARLQGVPRHLRQALAHWKRVPTPARTPHPLRLPSTSTMLVESDVPPGMRSLRLSVPPRVCSEPRSHSWLWRL
jgi:hypothetical protein